MSSSPDTDVRPGERSFLGQPRMLANLFSVELWERFSFYGMQGILLYYMYFSVADGGLGIDQGVATGLVGAYGGAVYLSTILGAWLADRVFGSERVLFYSAIMIMCGHISLAALPGASGLAVGLVLVAVGSGGLKATCTSLVGTLYAEGDERRDAGFSIFYMGINIGGLLGPLVTGWLQQSWGFHFGFAAAAVGMAIGLTQYALTRKNLPQESHHIANPLPPAEASKWVGIGAAALVVIAVAFLTGWVDAANLATVVAGVAIVAAVAYFALLLTSAKVSAVERRRVTAFIPLFIASAAFWALFQQQFTVVAIYSEQRLDREFFGWTMPPSFVQSINPIFIIIFAVVFAAMWSKMGSRQPSSPLKFAMGLVLMGVAFLLFIPFSTDQPNSAPLYGLVLVLLFFTWAELSLSPIGLSVATKLAPASFRTQMVALFFLSVSLGTTLAGVLAGYYDPSDEIGYFAFSGVTAIVLGLALAAATPSIKKLMSGVH